MIDPALISLEADQMHRLTVLPGRAAELARECDTLLEASRQLRPMLSFDDSSADFQRALLQAAAPEPRSGPEEE